MAIPAIPQSRTRTAIDPESIPSLALGLSPPRRRSRTAVEAPMVGSRLPECRSLAPAVQTQDKVQEIGCYYRCSKEQLNSNGKEEQAGMQISGTGNGIPAENKNMPTPETESEETRWRTQISGTGNGTLA